MTLLFVYSPIPEEHANKIAKKLLDESLIACANIIDSVSLYYWKGNLEEGNEKILILKSRSELKKKLLTRLEELHPYEVPCILVFEPSVNKEYLDWVKEVT